MITSNTFLFFALFVGVILLIPLLLNLIDDLTSPDFIETCPAEHTRGGVSACSTASSVFAPSFKYRTERLGVFYVGESFNV